MKNFLLKIQDNPKTKHWIIGIVMFLGLGSLLVFSDFGVLKFLNLEYQKRQILSDIKEIKANKDSLLNEINAMKNDTFEIEKIAREKYGMVKPNEQIFFVLPDSLDSLK